MLKYIAVIRAVRMRSANLPNRYSSLCWRPVTHAQTWASDSALYRFGRLSMRSLLHNDCTAFSALSSICILSNIKYSNTRLIPEVGVNYRVVQYYQTPGCCFLIQVSSTTKFWN